MTLAPDLFLTRELVFSSDPARTYRYRFTRLWDTRLPRWLFIMLNPSDADEAKDDPTSTRVFNFVQGWGGGAVSQMNLYGFRSPEPKNLYRAADPAGPENLAHLATELAIADHVIVAWGAHPMVRHAAADIDMLELIRAAGHVPLCLRITKHGYPEHPLYLPADLTPIAYVRHT